MHVTVVNLGPARDLSVTVRRQDADVPVLDRVPGLQRGEFVHLVLREPDVWTVEVALPDGASEKVTLDEFDCNSRHVSVGARCGQFTTSGGASLVGCASYPVNESRSQQRRAQLQVVT